MIGLVDLAELASRCQRPTTRHHHWILDSDPWRRSGVEFACSDPEWAWRWPRMYRQPRVRPVRISMIQETYRCILRRP